MFDEPLPKQADVRKLASREAQFNVKLKLGVMQRISDIIVSDKGFVGVNLHVGVDGYRDRFLRGDIHCEAEVVCQRCLQPVAITVDAPFDLQIVWNEERAKQLKGDVDPLIVADDELVNLNEVIEDELLLSFPLVSNHLVGECQGKQTYESTSDDCVVEEKEKENPFSVLANFKAGK